MKIAALILLAAQGSAPLADDAFSDVASAFAYVQQGGSQSRAARTIESVGGFPATDLDDVSHHWKVKAAPAAAYRDRTLGPAYKVLSLGAGKSAKFEQTFLAGQRARITVVPRQGTRFQLSVTDDDGKRQCAAADRAPCDWTPLWTSRYRIELSNPGHASALYYVVMQ